MYENHVAARMLTQKSEEMLQLKDDDLF